jgi:hypothetical protein
MTTNSFSLSVSHSQVVVFDRSLAEPFTFWTQKHVDQGFAWRHGSASFRTLEDGGHYLIQVIVTSDEAPVSADAVRVIEVPFQVSAKGLIEIASIIEAFPIELSAGLYALRFECFSADRGSYPTIKLIFIRRANPAFKVVRADAELSIYDEMLCNASPV